MDAQRKQKLVDYWANGSKEDLVTAVEIISKTSRFVSGLFFLHLAVEKKLKSIYVEKINGEAPLTHNLIFLVDKCGIAIDLEQTKFLAAVNEFNIETRYPSETQALYHKATKEFCESYLKKTEEFILWISKK